MSRIRLVTRADDLGSFSGTTPAAIDAHRHGMVRNASVMVNTPWFEDAARALRQAPGLCLGVHLNISCEWEGQRWRPVSPPESVPCLVDGEGCLHKDTLVVHKRGVVLSQLMREVAAQVARARAYGLDIRYLDTHCGWEWVHEPAGPPRMSDLLPGWCRRQGLIWHGLLRSGRLSLDGAGTLAQRLIAGAEQRSAGEYLEVIHPCWPSQAIACQTLGGAPGAVAENRMEEAATLRDPALARELERRGVQFVRYDEVLSPSSS